MAENSTKTDVRKLRKKLRQIEHLERLERDFTQEEYEKVSFAVASFTDLSKKTFERTHEFTIQLKTKFTNILKLCLLLFVIVALFVNSN